MGSLGGPKLSASLNPQAARAWRCSFGFIQGPPLNSATLKGPPNRRQAFGIRVSRGFQFSGQMIQCRSAVIRGLGFKPSQQNCSKRYLNPPTQNPKAFFACNHRCFDFPKAFRSPILSSEAPGCPCSCYLGPLRVRVFVFCSLWHSP